MESAKIVNETPKRCFLVDGKRVSIITSTSHTYNVRFVKSGIFMDVKKCYVKTWYPKPKKVIPKKPIIKTETKNSQTELKF